MRSATITLTAIEVLAEVGIEPKELVGPQSLLLDVTIQLSPSSVLAAAKHDELPMTVDYVTVAKIVRDEVKRKRRNLIETLGNDIGQALLQLPLVSALTVTIHKTQAIPHSHDTSVTLVWER